jgi:predicted enzyme related to lactoylglutathione lyase
VFDAIKAGDLDTLRAVLRARPTLVNSKDSNGNSPVQLACYMGQSQALNLLLRSRPHVNIFEAAMLGRLARVKSLVNARPRLLHAYSHDGFTALHLAAFFGKASVARFLVQKGAPVNAVAHNPTQVQPLHSAVAGNVDEICALLLRHGADVNARQQGGFTPLHAAAQNGKRELVRRLREYGADLRAATEVGKTARDFALEKGHAELAQMLVTPIGVMNRVILFVTDMPAMRAFYEQVIGLQPIGHQDAGWVSYDTGGAALSLHGGAKRRMLTAAESGKVAQVVFHVDDVPAARAVLVSRGARMKALVKVSEQLAFCDGQDPEGNWFQISSR